MQKCLLCHSGSLAAQEVRTTRGFQEACTFPYPAPGQGALACHRRAEFLSSHNLPTLLQTTHNQYHTRDDYVRPSASGLHANSAKNSTMCRNLCSHLWHQNVLRFASKNSFHVIRSFVTHNKLVKYSIVRYVLQENVVGLEVSVNNVQARQNARMPGAMLQA